MPNGVITVITMVGHITTNGEHPMPDRTYNFFSPHRARRALDKKLSTEVKNWNDTGMMRWLVDTEAEQRTHLLRRVSFF